MARVEGLDRLRRRVSALPRNVRAEMQAAVFESASRVEALAKALAPVEDGELRDSIRTEPGEHELQAVVRAGGPTTTKPVRKGETAPRFDYAPMVEFGPNGQPFLFPAYRSLKRVIKARLRKAYRTAAAKSGGGT